MASDSKRERLAPDMLQRLLDRQPPDGYLAKAAAHIAAPNDESRIGTEAVILFEVASECLTLPLGILQEVAYDCAFHRLPQRPRLHGIVNVRGELLICASLEQLIGIDAAPRPGNGASTIPQLLVCERDGLRVAFPVRSVLGTLQYHPEERVPVPATLSGSKSALSNCVLRWRGRTAGCLDDGVLFAALRGHLS